MSFALIEQDVNALPDKSISVREKWREVQKVRLPDVINRFEAGTRDMLIQDVAPLMQWRNLEGREVAYRFDLLITQLWKKYQTNFYQEIYENQIKSKKS
mgnify:CR=1 FL=1